MIFKGLLVESSMSTCMWSAEHQLGTTAQVTHCTEAHLDTYLKIVFAFFKWAS